MIIRVMQQSDIPAALGVVADAWGKKTAQMAQPDFSDAFASSAWKPIFYVAEIDGFVVGTACYVVSWLCYGVYNLAWVAVQKEFRGRGIGRSLVERCLADLSPIADEIMLATNVPDFYRPMGFVRFGGLKTTENLGEHIMVLHLTE
jgi:predicted N-acetyltransferase YhbS